MEKTIKRIRFENVASNRVQRIIDTLRLLQNCSNKNNYEYTDVDVNKMFSEISSVLKETKQTFINELNKNNKNGFTF